MIRRPAPPASPIKELCSKSPAYYWHGIWAHSPSTIPLAPPVLHRRGNEEKNGPDRSGHSPKPQNCWAEHFWSKAPALVRYEQGSLCERLSPKRNKSFTRASLRPQNGIRHGIRRKECFLRYSAPLASIAAHNRFRCTISTSYNPI